MNDHQRQSPKVTKHPNSHPTKQSMVFLLSFPSLFASSPFLIKFTFLCTISFLLSPHSVPSFDKIFVESIETTYFDKGNFSQIQKKLR